AACRSAKLFQQGGKFVPVQGKGKNPVAGGGVAYRQIVAADVALALRQENFHPAIILGADHFHLRPVGKLGKGLVICPRTGTDVEIAPIRDNSAGLVWGAVVLIGKLDALVGDSDIHLRSQQGRKQGGHFFVGHGFRRAGAFLGVSAFGVLGGAGRIVAALGVLGVQLNAAGGGGSRFLRQRGRVRVSAPGKGGGGKGREAQHSGQRHGKGAKKLILHRRCPPVRPVQNPAAGPGVPATRRRAHRRQIPPASCSGPAQAGRSANFPVRSLPLPAPEAAFAAPRSWSWFS